MAFSVPQIGDTFEERYQLVSRLGAGSYALVFKAEQLNVGRVVAVKILLPTEKGFDDATLMRFQREAKLLAQLRHPNTLILHDFGWTQAGHPFLVTEFIPGVTLKDDLVAKGHLDATRSVHILRQILGSLKEAHAYGVIHRDVKPANIMMFDRLDEKDVVKVLDFGIAKFVDSVSDDDAIIAQDLTARDRLMGTPRYMAPEQLAKKTLAPATDIYALGLLFYEMLTGRHAVEGRTSAVVIARQLDDKPVIRKDDPDVPAHLQKFIQRCTAKLMDERFQTVQEALDCLDTSAAEAAPLAKNGDGSPSTSRTSLVSLAVKAASRLVSKDKDKPTPTPEPAEVAPVASANPSSFALPNSKAGSRPLPGPPGKGLPLKGKSLPPPSIPPGSSESLALSTADIVLDDVAWPEMPPLPSAFDAPEGATPEASRPEPGTSQIDISKLAPMLVSVNLPEKNGAAQPLAPSLEQKTTEIDRIDVDSPSGFVTVDIEDDEIEDEAASASPTSAETDDDIEEMPTNALETIPPASGDEPDLATLAAAGASEAETSTTEESRATDAAPTSPDTNADDALSSFDPSKDDDEPIIAGKTPIWIYGAIAAAVLVVIGLVVVFSGGDEVVEKPAVAENTSPPTANTTDKPPQDEPKVAEDDLELPLDPPADTVNGETNGAAPSDDLGAAGGTNDDGGEEAAEERKILVQSEPQGAQVKVDAKVLGETPLFVTASLDRKTQVELAHQGYKPHRFDLGPDSEDEVTIKLQPSGPAPVAVKRNTDGGNRNQNTQRRRRTDGKDDGKDKKSRFTPF